MTSLADRTVIVTGGAGALGAGVVSVLADDGARVFVAGTPRSLEGVTFPAGVSGLPVDLLDAPATQSMVATAREATGRLDGLVCLAGGFFGDTLAASTPAEALRDQFDLNVVTAFNAIQAVLPAFLAAGAGAIVAVSSRPALRVEQGTVAYGTAKLAVAKVIETVAEEYRDAGVRANAVAPSIIDTPANRRAMPGADFTRWVAPEAIGRVIRFLLSDDATPVSGAIIPVYGRA